MRRSSTSSRSPRMPTARPAIWRRLSTASWTPTASRPTRPNETHAGHGWGVLAAFVVAWDVKAPETLSSGFNRHRKHPLVVIGWLTLTSHLFGLIPPRCDPFLCFLIQFKRQDGGI